MTKSQGAKSQPNPNDQAPNPKEEGRSIANLPFGDLVIGAWDLIGIWRLGHWSFGGPVIGISPKHLLPSQHNSVTFSDPAKPRPGNVW